MSPLGFMFVSGVYACLMVIVLIVTLVYEQYIWDGDDPDWYITAYGFFGLCGMYSLGASAAGLSFLLN